MGTPFGGRFGSLLGFIGLSAIVAGGLTAIPAGAAGTTTTTSTTLTGVCQENNFTPQANHQGGATTTATPPDGSTVSIGQTIGAVYYDEAGLANANDEGRVINGITVHAPQLIMTNNAGGAVTDIPTSVQFTVGAPEVKGKTVANITGIVPTVAPGTYTVFLKAYDLDQNAQPDCGNVTWTLKVAGPSTGTLKADIFICGPDGQPTGEEGPGTISFGPLFGTGKGSLAATTNLPLSQAVDAGDWQVMAQAGSLPGATFALVSCGQAGSIDNHFVTVPPGGTGSTVFYETRSPVVPPGNLAANLLICDASGNPTSAQGPGSIAYGLQGGAMGASSATLPISAVVAAGTYTVNATAGTNYTLVACGQTAGISTQAVKVPSGGTGTATFYEQANPGKGTLTGIIYLCVNGQVTTQVGPGTVASDPSVGLTPGVAVSVDPGQYVVSATAGGSYTLVNCGGPGSPQTVTVSPGQSRVVAFYEQAPAAGQVLGASIQNPATGSDLAPIAMRSMSLVFLGLALLSLSIGRRRKVIGRR